MILVDALGARIFLEGVAVGGLRVAVEENGGRMARRGGDGEELQYNPF